MSTVKENSEDQGCGGVGVSNVLALSVWGTTLSEVVGL